MGVGGGIYILCAFFFLLLCANYFLVFFLNDAIRTRKKGQFYVRFVSSSVSLFFVNHEMDVGLHGWGSTPRYTGHIPRYTVHERVCCVSSQLFFLDAAVLCSCVSKQDIQN